MGSSATETGDAAGCADFVFVDSAGLWLSMELFDLLASVAIPGDAVSAGTFGVLKDSEDSDDTTSVAGFLDFFADEVFFVTVEALVERIVFGDSVPVDLGDSATEELDTAGMVFLVDVFWVIAVVFWELVFSVLFCDAVEVFFLAMVC